jgi:hypothetical protein
MTHHKGGQAMKLSDLMVTTDDRQAKTFCEVVAPIFAEILMAELAKTEVVTA